MAAETFTDAAAGSDGDAPAPRRYRGPIIDCDVHQSWADEGEIRRRLPAYCQQPWAGLASSPWPSPIGVLRSDAVPEEGGPAGSSPALMAEQLLDAYGIVRAILTGQSVLTAGVHADADFGCELASAYNDALLETWLSADDRFLGSLAVAPQRPQQAAADFMGQLTSLVCEGVFVEFPDLRFVMIEGGLAWIPAVLWRLDKNWKGLRHSVPWLTRAPSEYVLAHVRFTSQPIEEPERPEHLLTLFEAIHADQTVMFATDYPHWDGDAPDHAIPPLPPHLARRVFFDNAADLYGLHAATETRQLRRK